MRPALLVLGAALVALTACDRTRGPKPPADDAGKPKSKAAAAADPAPVRVARLTVGPISETLETTGDLQAEQWTDVVVRRAGLVERLRVEEGQVVEAKQPLLDLDRAEPQILLEQARADADLAERRATLASAQIVDAQITVDRLRLVEAKAQTEFDRYNRLPPGVIQVEELEARRFERDRTRKEREAAENALERVRIEAKIAVAEHEAATLKVGKAEIDLDYATPTAPFAGVISLRHVQAGQYLAANQVAYTLVDVSKLRLDVNLPQRYLPRLRAGQIVTLETEAFPERTFDAVLRRVSPVVGEKGTIKVTIEVHQDALLLRPGMYVAATIVLDTREKALLASKRAVVYDTAGGAPFVFIVRPDGDRRVAQKRRVDIGYRRTDHVEIIPVSDDPPTVGDDVIIAGQDDLRGGEPVRVVDDSTRR